MCRRIVLPLLAFHLFVKVSLHLVKCLEGQKRSPKVYRCTANGMLTTRNLAKMPPDDVSVCTSCVYAFCVSSERVTTSAQERPRQKHQICFLQEIFPLSRQEGDSNGNMQMKMLLAMAGQFFTSITSPCPFLFPPQSSDFCQRWWKWRLRERGWSPKFSVAPCDSPPRKITGRNQRRKGAGQHVAAITSHKLIRPTELHE